MVRQVLTALHISVLAFCAAGTAGAATISGTLSNGPGFATSFTSSDLRYPDGSPFNAGTVLMLCIDYTTHEPAGHFTFTTQGGAAAIVGAGGVQSVAGIHWLFDHYYASMFVSGTDVQQYAFQHALWELGNDFNGTALSMDENVGVVKPSEDAYFGTGAGGPVDPDFEAAYTTLYTAMRANIPGLPSTYRSTTYNLDLLVNHDPAYQNLVVLYTKASQPTAIPLPVSWVGWGTVLGGLWALGRRRRAAWFKPAAFHAPARVPRCVGADRRPPGKP